MIKTFTDLLDCITHDLNYTPPEVIAAIDELCERHSEFSAKQWSTFSEAAYKLKWADHYPTHITNPDQALKDNPGFYIDLVLWQGWAKTKRMADGSPEVAGPQA